MNAGLLDVQTQRADADLLDVLSREAFPCRAENDRDQFESRYGM